MHDHHDHPEVTVEKSPMIADNTIITITIPWKEAEQAYQNAIPREGKNVKLPGFRKGKLPHNIIEQSLGRERIMLSAINNLLPKKYPSAVEKSGAKPITYPEFIPKSIEWGKDWVVEAHVAEAPEIKLGNYAKTIKEAHKEAEKAITKDKDKKLTEQQIKDVKLETVIKNLVTSIKPAIPEIMVKQQAHQELHNLEGQLRQVNMDLNMYLERRKINQTQLVQELTAQALAQLQTDFILLEISKAEKIEVSDKEIDQQLGEQVKKATPDLRQMVKNSLQRRKLVDFLLN